MYGASIGGAGPKMRTQDLLIVYVLPVVQACLLAQQPGGRLCGTVLDQNDGGLAGAIIIASGVGLQGWATSNADGTFCLRAAGAFVSVRHAGYNPVLLPISGLGPEARIRLGKADGATKVLSSCRSFTGNGRSWIGGVLRIKPPRGGYRGPVNGEHDTHWYVHFRGKTLHIVDGYAWHSGLPIQSLLVKSTSLAVHGWEFKDIVGLDVSGQLDDGTYWRWFGAPVADAISYENASLDEAKFFDGVLESVCFGAR
jgi:hypothetical protein